MKIRKRVTSKQAAANRLNSKKSTGPRTPWGKQTSSRNALKFGLFSEDVVNPHCDGKDAAQKHKGLVNQLEEELNPVGALESFYVQMAADCLWRLRRARRAERGSAVVGIWDTTLQPEQSLKHQLVSSMVVAQSTTAILNGILEESRESHMLSEALYRKALTILSCREQDVSKPAKKGEERPQVQGRDIRAAEPATTTPSAKEGDQCEQNKVSMKDKRQIDDDFIRKIENKKFLLQCETNSYYAKLNEIAEGLAAKCALPPPADSDRILRYEAQMLRQLDWALERLADCQQRRETAGMKG